ncbi:MAG: PorV/PorQ family protein, partial [Rhizobacter sp.]|nr:PorV/PorQ family protein [Chlorobiales bacterium]
MQKSFLLFSCLFLTGSFLSVPDSSAQIGGIAGSFARVGFSSRGMALGNAGSAVTLDGELQPYYNPAVIGFAAFNTASATYAYLPLDRTLNFVSFTGNIGPTAGLGLSLINSGVGNIDARDIDGNQTGILSTSENLFMLSFANRFSDELSVGISLRGYLSSLYEDVSSAFALGFDFGAAYRQPIDSVSSVSFALVLADVGSRYRWDTVPVYGQQGSTTTDPMPLAVRLGSSYRCEGLFGFNLVMLTAELELLSAQFDNEQTVFFIENGIAKS